MPAKIWNITGSLYDQRIRQFSEGSLSKLLLSELPQQRIQARHGCHERRTRAIQRSFCPQQRSAPSVSTTQLVAPFDAMAVALERPLTATGYVASFVEPSPA